MQFTFITFFIPNLIKIDLKYRQVRRVEQASYASQVTNISIVLEFDHIAASFFNKQQSVMVGLENNRLSNTKAFFFISKTMVFHSTIVTEL